MVFKNMRNIKHIEANLNIIDKKLLKALFE